MNNTNDEAIVQAGVNPDFGVQDLYDAIAAGNYPSWTIYWQILTPQEAEVFKCLLPVFSGFLTLILSLRQRLRPDQRFIPLSSNYMLLALTLLLLEWLPQDVPLQEIGRITLVQNPYGFVAFDVHTPQLLFFSGQIISRRSSKLVSTLQTWSVFLNVRG